MYTSEKIKTAAKMFGVSETWAIARRIDFLVLRLSRIQSQLKSAANNPLCSDDDIIRMANMALRIKREIKRLKQPKNTDGITDEMIEIARSYPVELLVEFTRGKTRAWCHDDKNPSMYHGTRKNVAVCPVCDKKFGPIDVLMARDGLSFIEAVRSLQ